ncbi:MAG: LapA family protein [Spirochaetes bacterium]|nr:LapA family protein [Spirochaetota bacterium]
MSFKLLFFLTFLILFAIFIVKNNRIISIDFVFFERDVSFVVILIVTFLFGFVLSFFAWLGRFFKKGKKTPGNASGLHENKK